MAIQQSKRNARKGAALDLTEIQAAVRKTKLMAAASQAREGAGEMSPGEGAGGGGGLLSALPKLLSLQLKWPLTMSMLFQAGRTSHPS